jgi:pilus assembly protein CpaC
VARLASAFAGDDVINMLSLGSPQQVMLEVRFAEVNRTVGEKLGVSGFANSLGGSFRGVTGSGASARSDGLGGNQLGIDPILDNFGIFSALFSIGDVDIEAFLNALEEQGVPIRLMPTPTICSMGIKLR